MAVRQSNYESRFQQEGEDDQRQTDIIRHKHNQSHMEHLSTLKHGINAPAHSLSSQYPCVRHTQMLDTLSASPSNPA
jgi:superfamily I DNA and RNA helicase